MFQSDTHIYFPESEGQLERGLKIFQNLDVFGTFDVKWQNLAYPSVCVDQASPLAGYLPPSLIGRSLLWSGLFRSLMSHTAQTLTSYEKLRFFDSVRIFFVIFRFVQNKPEQTPASYDGTRRFIKEWRNCIFQNHTAGHPRQVLYL